MTTTTLTPGTDTGLPDRLAAYLSTLQEDSLQLEMLLEALNSLAAYERRRDLTLGLIEGALKIASELNIALDSVTIAKELEGAQP